MTRDEGDIRSLSGTAMAVWDLLDRPRSIAEIADALARRYRGPVATVRADVDSLVRELHRQGLVHEVPEPRG